MKAASITPLALLPRHFLTRPTKPVGLPENAFSPTTHRRTPAVTTVLPLSPAALFAIPSRQYGDLRPPSLLFTTKTQRSSIINQSPLAMTAANLRQRSTNFSQLHSRSALSMTSVAMSWIYFRSGLVLWLLALLAIGSTAMPYSSLPHRYSIQAQMLADPTYGPIPGQSSHYSTYWGLDRPFPGNISDPIFPTEDGPPGDDDAVWQNLLAAEWIIFEFYQQGIERFTSQDFVKAGMPETTHSRLVEIRNNEAGHLRIFQNQISPTSIKPGACKYKFPLSDARAYLGFMTVMEISSMAFLTGLVQQANLDFNKGALAAISQTETRHEVWALMDVWKMNPFAGPADTVFPYANQILYSTHGLVVPDSCPPENPEYPTPLQVLPDLWAMRDTKSIDPGSTITLYFPDKENLPVFDDDTQYYAVFFHSVHNISVPINTEGFPERPIDVTIPAVFEPRGIMVALLADEEGAPTKESVVAGPAVILEQPSALGLALVRGGPS